jgi:hypothetical protein
MVDLVALARAHDFCIYLLDKGDAHSYTEAIRLCRRAGKQYDPQGQFKNNRKGNASRGDVQTRRVRGIIIK